MGKDVMAMKVVVGEEALRMEDHLYLTILELSKGNLLAQGTYKAQAIFKSNDNDGPARAVTWVTAH